MKITGVLLKDFNGEVFFRRYHKEGNFTDFSINCSDIDITIDDDNVKMVVTDTDDEGNSIGYIDYTDEVLGN